MPAPFQLLFDLGLEDLNPIEVGENDNYPDQNVYPTSLNGTILHYIRNGWGDLYIMDYPTKDYVDKVESPYEEGMLYQTGRTARITHDGRVEFLEDAGRVVMLETLRGREYVDLLQVEKVLCQCDGVTTAQAYTYYGGDNVLLVGADIAGVEENDFERVKAYAAEHLKVAWVPTRLMKME